jgi:hypothetical protein
MGFMDKAKKMAEQAQAKLDEAQKQFNQSQDKPGEGGGTPPVEYDKHGRPIPQAGPPEGVTPPHGDPLGGAPAPAAPPAPPPPAPPAPPAPAAGPQAPATPPGPATGAEDDRNKPSYEPPKMSSGDPLAG